MKSEDSRKEGALMNNNYNNGNQDPRNNGQNYYYNNPYGYNNGRPPINPMLLQKPTSGMATASLVLGIIGILFTCCCGTGAVLGLIGLILAIVDRKRNGSFSSVALGGLITSIIAVVLGVAFFAFCYSIGTDTEFMSLYESMYESMLLEEGLTI